MEWWWPDRGTTSSGRKRPAEEMLIMARAARHVLATGFAREKAWRLPLGDAATDLMSRGGAPRRGQAKRFVRLASSQREGARLAPYCLSA